MSADTSCLSSRLVDLLGGGGSGREAVAAQRLVTLLGSKCCLERFLVARQGDSEKAEAMFRDVARWRAEIADTITTDPEALRSWDAIEPYWMGTSRLATGGVAGPTPIAYVGIGYVLPLYMHFSEQRIYHGYVRHIENELACQVSTREACQRESNEAFDTPKMVEIYDLRGVGVSHLRCIGGLRMLVRVLGVGQRYYPENLGQAFIVNAPRFFDAAWRIVGKALDEQTKRKVQVTHEAVHPGMRRFLSDDELEALRHDVKPFPLSGDPTVLRFVRADT